MTDPKRCCVSTIFLMAQKVILDILYTMLSILTHVIRICLLFISIVMLSTWGSCHQVFWKGRLG